MKRTILTATLAAMALGAPAAHAGEPFTIGEGKAPHLAVDQSSGTAHVAWHNDATDRVHYCQVPRGATACAVSAELNPGFDPGPVFILQDGTTLRILMPHYVNSKTYQFTSADNGATWSAIQQIYDEPNTTDPTEPVLGPQAGEITFASWNVDRRIFAAKTDGTESAGTAFASMPDGGNTSLDYDLQVAPTTDGGLIATANDLSNTYFWRMNPSLDPSVGGSWSAAPTLVGPVDTSRVAGGTSGTFLFGAADGAARAEIRRWNGAGFDAPVVVADETPYINDVIVGPSGAIAAIWRANDSSAHRLKLALSTDAGATFAVSQIAREDTVMMGMDVALATDNGGFATYQGKEAGSGSKNFIRLLDLTAYADPSTGTPTTTTPAPTPTTPLYAGPTKKKVVSGNGAQFTFTVPRSCIPSGTSFRVRLTWRKQKRKGNKFVKVFRSDFYIGKTRKKIDRKAPFSQVLTITNPVKGATYTVRARAFIKVRRGRSPKKSIVTKVKVCS